MIHHLQMHLYRNYMLLNLYSRIICVCHNTIFIGIINKCHNHNTEEKVTISFVSCFKVIITCVRIKNLQFLIHHYLNHHHYHYYNYPHNHTSFRDTNNVITICRLIIITSSVHHNHNSSSKSPTKFADNKDAKPFNE